MSQESHDGRYAAVYLCAELDDDSGGFSEIYHASAPPVTAKGGNDGATSLARIYDNIRILLDEDQGSFHEGRNSCDLTTEYDEDSSLKSLTVDSLSVLSTIEMLGSHRDVC